jgi:hypothetical protein
MSTVRYKHGVPVTRFGALLFAAALGSTMPARAQGISQRECLDSFERAQRDRKAGKLRASRTGFRTCANAGCPRLVRKDCNDALAALTTAIPSVRVTVRDASGAELDEFSLEIDGQSVEASDEAIELDPGEHILSFAAADGSAREERVTLKPGDLNVPVIVTLGANASFTDRGAPRTAPGQRRPTPPIVYVLSGIAALGLAGFVGFGLSGRSAESCKGHCSEAEIDRVNREYLLADIGLAVFAAAGGGAAYFYFSRPSVGSGPGDVRQGLSFRAGVSF